MVNTYGINLGNAYAAQGDMTRAALNYKRAAERSPDDAGIQRNLNRALQALGRAQPEVSSVAAAPTAGGKAAAGDLDVDSFYWME